MIAHAALGCATAAVAGTDCAAGAVAGVTGELVGLITQSKLEDWLNNKIAQVENGEQIDLGTLLAEFNDLKAAGVDVARLASGLMVALMNGDVDIGADIGGNAVENNALCGGWCMAAVASLVYTAWIGDGNLLSGLQVVSKGEDPLSKFTDQVVNGAVEIAYENYPQETLAVLETLEWASGVADAVVTYVDNQTGNVVSENWSKLDQSTREQITGGAITLNRIVVTATSLKTITEVRRLAAQKLPADTASDIKKPTLTIQDHYAHHKAMTEDLKAQLVAQGYRVSKKEISFGDACGNGRCRPDIVYQTPDGRYGIIEVKTGNADLTIRQSQIYPQISNGDAIPRGKVAAAFQLKPNLSLREQGYPNGIPIEIRVFPGAE